MRDNDAEGKTYLSVITSLGIASSGQGKGKSAPSNETRKARLLCSATFSCLVFTVPTVSSQSLLCRQADYVITLLSISPRQKVVSRSDPTADTTLSLNSWVRWQG